MCIVRFATLDLRTLRRRSELRSYGEVMNIFGGFAGHGGELGVSVEPQTLRRCCNDCGHSWLSAADEGVRVAPGCRAEVASIRAKPDQGGSYSTDGDGPAVEPKIWADRGGLVTQSPSINGPWQP
jgi:hypothetical protein